MKGVLGEEGKSGIKGRRSHRGGASLLETFLPSQGAEWAAPGATEAPASCAPTPSGASSILGRDSQVPVFHGDRSTGTEDSASISH